MSKKEPLELDIAKVLNQKKADKRQHNIVIKHYNWVRLQVLAKKQGYSQAGVYLNDMLEEIFNQVEIKTEDDDSNGKQ